MTAPEVSLYYVYSKWSLKGILTHIRKCFPSYNDDDFNALIGPIRIDYYRGGETDRTLCLFNDIIYEGLAKEGFTQKLCNYDFRIQPYEIRDKNLPGQGYSSNLYIPLPSSLNTDHCREDLVKKLKVLETFSIINKNYKLTFPLTSRKTGRLTGSAFIEFDSSIDIHKRAIVLLVLHDTDWNVPNSQDYRVKCLWARDRDQRYRLRAADKTVTTILTRGASYPVVISSDGSVSRI